MSGSECGFDGALPTALIEWAMRKSGCSSVERVTVDPLPGGAVSSHVERVTLHLGPMPTGSFAISVVRKRSSTHEINGLRAAQAVRPAATAVPELITYGLDDAGPWLISEMCRGKSLSNRSEAIPEALFDSLARLHAEFRSTTSTVVAVPHVDARWWRELCLSWVRPRVRQHASRHATGVGERADALVTMAAENRRVDEILARMTPTLIHGDVHPSNVIVDGERAGLIDWGSGRIGSAMLDLANLVEIGSDGFGAYSRAWHSAAGRSLDMSEVVVGYRWSALQIPVQYLPWVVEHRNSAAVMSSLDQIEHALENL